MSLTVKDLTKRFGDRTVVDRLSFEMPGPGGVCPAGHQRRGKNHQHPHDAEYAVPGRGRGAVEQGTRWISAAATWDISRGGAGPVPRVCR